jgi:hypothetical protein
VAQKEMKEFFVLAWIAEFEVLVIYRTLSNRKLITVKNLSFFVPVPERMFHLHFTQLEFLFL